MVFSRALPQPPPPPTKTKVPQKRHRQMSRRHVRRPKPKLLNKCPFLVGLILVRLVVENTLELETKPKITISRSSAFEMTCSWGVAPMSF